MKRAFNFGNKPILKRKQQMPPEVKKKRPKPKIPKRLYEEEVGLLLDALDNRRDYLAVLFCLNTGVRVGELCGLKWNDIWDFKSQMPRREVILREEITKGHKERIVPLNKKAYKALEDMWEYYSSSGYVPTPNSPYLRGREGHLSRRQFQRIIKNAREKAGLNRIQVTPHKLRHTFASEIYCKTKDILSLQELLGHSNISTTQIYAHVDQNSKRSAVDSI